MQQGITNQVLFINILYVYNLSLYLFYLKIVRYASIGAMI